MKTLVRQKKSFLYRLLIPFTMIVISLIIGLTVLLSLVYRDAMVSQICGSTLDKLQQSHYSLGFLGDQVKTIATAVVTDPILNRLALENDLNVFQLNESLNKLRSLRYSSELVHSIYIYNRKTRMVYITSVIQDAGMEHPVDSFFDREFSALLPQLHTYDRLTPIPRQLLFETGSGRRQTADVYSYVLYDFFSSTQTVDNVIIINIPANLVAKNVDIGGTAGTENAYTQMIDAAGTVVFSSRGGQFLTDGSDQPYVRQALAQSVGKGYFYARVDGEEYLVTYLRPESSGWVYLRLTPSSVVTDSLVSVLRTIGLIAVLVLALGVIMLVAASRRIATPVNTMIDQLRRYRLREEDGRAQKRRYFLLELTQGSWEGTGEALAAQFEEAGLNIRPGTPSFVVLLAVDRARELSRQLAPSERRHLSRALAQHARAAFAESYACDVVELADDRVLAVCSTDEDAHMFRLEGDIRRLLAALQEDFAQGLAVDVSAAVSGVGRSHRELPYLLAEANDALSRRYCTGYRSILFTLTLPAVGQDQPVYPRQTEGRILEALMGENLDAACREMAAFAKAVWPCAPVEIRVMLMNLAIAVKTVLGAEMVLGMQQQPIDFDQLLADIQSRETLKEAVECFHGLFAEVVRQLGREKRLKYDALLCQIEGYIQENFTDQGLSINAVADHVNLSATYLGRLYRQLEGESIADRIMEVRLKRAEKLLLEEDCSIHELAEAIGFTNSSYFHMVFKKKHGITPSSYRNRHQKKLMEA